MKLVKILRRTSAVDHHRWHELADFNAEVARGLVHTDVWKAKMADQQAAFNAEQRARYLNDDSIIVIDNTTQARA